MYTLVQHSGYGYAGNPQFRQGLETRELRRKGDQERVRKLGGVLFANYAEAEEAAHALMYPDDGFYLTPRFKGTFATAVVDGLKIAIPEPLPTVGASSEREQAARIQG